jgi:hypothetical protein
MIFTEKIEYLRSRDNFGTPVNAGAKLLQSSIVLIF